MMANGDEKIVADRIYQVLSAKHTLKPVEAARSPRDRPDGPVDRSTSKYAAGKTTHTLHLRQQQNGVTGTHQGDFLARDISGTISGDAITLASNRHRTARRCVDLPFQRQDRRELAMPRRCRARSISANISPPTWTGTALSAASRTAAPTY